jgi:hypothetical protein
MGLLKDIQDNATDPSCDTLMLLNQCMGLAYRLGHQLLKDWVNREIYGYSSTDELPEYRILKTEVRATITNGYTAINDYPIPSTYIHEDVRDVLTRVAFRSGSTHLVALDNSKALKVNWSGDAVALFNTRKSADVLKGYWIHEAWCVVAPGVIQSILNQVRSLILEFTFKIEDEVPSADEVPSLLRNIAPDRLTYIFNTTINGGQNTIGNSGGAVTTSMEVDMTEKNNFTFSNSQVGMVNTGTIKNVDSINANVQALSGAGQTNIAQALGELTKAFNSSQEISEEQRKEALELIESASQQAAQPAEKRLNHAVIGSILKGIASLADAAPALAKIWEAWGPHLHQFFVF